jgi:hypothetical protein
MLTKQVPESLAAIKQTNHLSEDMEKELDSQSIVLKVGDAENISAVYSASWKSNVDLLDMRRRSLEG